MVSWTRPLWNVDTLNGLLDAANSADIVAKETHSGYLDVSKGDPHLVDKVEVHKVCIFVGHFG